MQESAGEGTRGRQAGDKGEGAYLPEGEQRTREGQGKGKEEEERV